jgi:hypothetical protein
VGVRGADPRKQSPFHQLAELPRRHQCRSEWFHVASGSLGVADHVPLWSRRFLERTRADGTFRLGAFDVLGRAALDQLVAGCLRGWPALWLLIVRNVAVGALVPGVRASAAAVLPSALRGPGAPTMESKTCRSTARPGERRSVLRLFGNLRQHGDDGSRRDGALSVCQPKAHFRPTRTT